MNAADMDQGYKINLGPVEVPTELQDNMLAAHQKLAEKRAHIGRIKAGKSDMEREIAEARQELDAAKKSHISGFAGFAEGATKLPAEAKNAKVKIAEIGGRILGLEETLPDFAEAIRVAQQDMIPLRDDLDRARREIVKLFIAQVPRTRTIPSELPELGEFIKEGGIIDLNAAMMLYLAVYDNWTGDTPGPFHPGGVHPAPFFNFLSKFFRKPSDESITMFWGKFNALLWGIMNHLALCRCRTRTAMKPRRTLISRGWGSWRTA